MNTSIMGVISAVKISAIFFHMLHAAPCVFSCYMDTKTAPIIPVIGGVRGGVLVRLTKAIVMAGQ